MFPAGAHLEPARGSSQQNRAYCTKEVTRRVDTEPHEFGVMPAGDGQGARSDIHGLRDAIKEGKSFSELADNDEHLPTLARHMNFATRLMTEKMRPPHRPDIYVRVCIGPAGCGKSTCAGLFDPELEAYTYDNELKGFWDGYHGQATVIFDEFRGHVLTPTQFNRLADKGPMVLNVKNGTAPCKVSDIRITTNYLPSQWWSEKTSYNKEALYRRIDEVHLHRFDEETEIFLSAGDKKMEDCAMLQCEARIAELGMNL